MEAEPRAPVQRGQGNPGESQPAGTVPWSTHLAAWANYGYGQDAETIAQRGGFSYREMQCALVGHYNETPTCRRKHPVPPGWEPR